MAEMYFNDFSLNEHDKHLLSSTCTLAYWQLSWFMALIHLIPNLEGAIAKINFSHHRHCDEFSWIHQDLNEYSVVSDVLYNSHACLFSMQLHDKRLIVMVQLFLVLGR